MSIGSSLYGNEGDSPRKNSYLIWYLAREQFASSLLHSSLSRPPAIITASWQDVSCLQIEPSHWEPDASSISTHVMWLLVSGPVAPSCFAPFFAEPLPCEL